MQANQLDGDTPDPIVGTADRSLAVGIVLSFSIHALLLAAFLSAARMDGPAQPRPQQSGGEPTMQVTLLPGSSAPSSSVSASEVPSQASAPVVRTAADLSRPPMEAIPKPQSAPPPSPSEQLAAGPSPGAAASNAAQTVAFDPAAGNDYRRRLLDHIALYRRTTAFADGGRSGTVLVRFSLNRGGTVLAVSIAASSGASELDDEAMATIWRAQPMPAIPIVLPERVTITLPVTFGIAARSPG